MPLKIFPELFSDGSWTVRESKEQTHGRTNPKHKVMEVPAGNTPREHYVRVHELAHVKWSPDFEEVDIILLRAGIPIGVKSIRELVKMIEDGRLNHLLGKAGFREMEGAAVFYHSTREQHDERLAQIQASVWMAMVTQGIIPRYCQQDVAFLRQEVPTLAAVVRRIRQLYEKNAAKGFEACVIPILKLLWKPPEEQQEEQEEPDSDGEGDGGEGEPEKGEEEKTSRGIIMVAIPGDMKPVEEMSPETAVWFKQTIQQEKTGTEVELPQPGTKEAVSDNQLVEEFVDLGLSSEYVRAQLARDEVARKRLQYDDGYHPGWGDAKMEDPKRSILITKKPAIKHSFSDSGQLLRQVHRQPIDGMIYVEPKRNFRKGTVLIDCSGSMSLSVESIRNIVKACPGMLVAGYAGERSYSTGIIRIFAKDGKMVEDAQLNLRIGSNIIDLPALGWLAKQKLPRFWISDGQVTGRGETQRRVLLEEAFEFIRRNRILRVDDLDEFERHCMKYRI